MDEEVWSQSEATPVVPQFPPSKALHNAPPGEWQAMHPGKYRNIVLIVSSADVRQELHSNLLSTT
jgi:hypothetical protein